MSPDRPNEAGAVGHHGQVRGRTIAILLAMVCAVLTTGTAATVYVASDTSRVLSAQRDVVPAARTAPESHRQAFAIRTLVDSLVAPLGPLPPIDSASLRSVVAMLAWRKDRDVWLDGAFAHTAPVDTLQLLRAWARSAPLPALWGYRVGFGNAESRVYLPFRHLFPLKRFMLLNEADADSALVHGDVEVAMLRARETLAGARHMLHEPNEIDMLVARMLLQRGARLLARAAQQGGEPYLVSAARRLDAMATANYASSRDDMRELLTLAENPRDGRLTSVAADTALPPAMRLATVRALRIGACLRPREILFGVSDERRLALEQIAGGIEDLPHAEQLVQLFRRQLESFDTPRPLLLPEGVLPKRMPSPLYWLVPPSVSDRVQFCQLVG